MKHASRRRLPAPALLALAVAACTPRAAVHPPAPQPERVLLRYRPQVGQRYVFAVLLDEQSMGQVGERTSARVETRVIAVAPDGNVTRETRFVWASRGAAEATEGLPAYREVVSPRGRTLSFVALNGDIQKTSGTPAAGPKEIEFPEVPVAVGDSWTATATRPLDDGRGNEEQRARVTLERIERRADGRTIAHLRIVVDTTSPPRVISPTLRVISSSRGEGRSAIDLRDGLLIDLEERNTSRVRGESDESGLTRTITHWTVMRMARRERMEDLPQFSLLSRDIAPPLEPACRARIAEFRRAVARSRSGWVMGEGNDRMVLELRRLPVSKFGRAVRDPSRLPKLIVPKDPCCVEFLGKRISPAELPRALSAWLAELARNRRPGEVTSSPLDGWLSMDARPELFVYADREVTVHRLGELLAPIRRTVEIYLMEENPYVLPEGAPPEIIARRVAEAEDRWKLAEDLFDATAGLCEPAGGAKKLLEADRFGTIPPARYVLFADRVVEGLPRCGCEFGNLDVLQYVVTHLWSLRGQHAAHIDPELVLDGPGSYRVEDLALR